MKKITLFVLCILLVLGTGGCANTQAETDAAQYACGKAAYDQLNVAADICVRVMDSVYNAWYFAIYSADDYTESSEDYERGLDVFVSKVGIPKELLEEAYMQYADTTLKGAQLLLPYALTKFQSTVSIVEYAYQISGAFDQLDTALSTAKAELKTMMELYSDYSEYPTLKAFYAEVNSYAEFAQNPSGSFQQLKTTIDNYETAIRTYKSELSFVFED